MTSGPARCNAGAMATKGQLRMQLERTCPQCKARFPLTSKRWGQKFCSRPCFYANRVARNKVERPCAGCGATFITKRHEVERGGGKYCSRACWTERHPRHPVKREVADWLSVTRKGAGNPAYRGDKIGIAAAHDRVRAIRGRAREYKCVACGRQALDWALSRDAETTHEATTKGMGRFYSLKVEDYMPMCRRCHVHYDHDGVFERYFGANARQG